MLRHNELIEMHERERQPTIFRRRLPTSILLSLSAPMYSRSRPLEILTNLQEDDPASSSAMNSGPLHLDAFLDRVNVFKLKEIFRQQAEGVEP